MRVYIIGNDGITLCRAAPAAVNNGEIAVASNEELRAAPLSAKRLLALWNALPDVEKRKRVGDRDALIDQLWSAIEALGPVRKLLNRLLIELDIGLQPSLNTIYCGGDRYRTHQRAVFGGGPVSR
jgi:hypothetical protein